MRRLAAALALVALAGCGGDGGDGGDGGGDDESRGMRLGSPAFEDGGALPALYTCDGKEIAPPLEWSGVPPEAQDLALIVEDTTVPVSAYVHWTVWRLPFAGGLGAIGEKAAAPGIQQGLTDLGEPGWAPPCPPGQDGPHRYVFTLHALEKPVSLSPDATAAQVRAALVADSIAEAELEVTYQGR